MIIQPKVREYICTTAHPLGCEESVRRQVAQAEKKGKAEGTKKALIIGCSTGYGLASRISAMVNCGADTLGIMFERPASGRRTATPGWYNTAAFTKIAEERGVYAKTLNGDAFSREMKEKTIKTIREDLGSVDLVIYSLAAPRRTDEHGVTWSSCLKTIGNSFTEKNLDLRTNEIQEKTLEPATQEEIEATVKVMGGEDWAEWIQVLSEAGVLAENAVTVAYSYIGPKLTAPIYYNGTIGAAKKHLHQTAEELNQRYPGVKAYISVNKGLVTQASSAIPVVPLYFTILYQVMKKQGVHEDCIGQMTRLFTEKLYGKEGVVTDSRGLIRMDDWELMPQVQEQVTEAWKKVTTENKDQYCDIKGYWEDFYHMFGFGYEGIDYEKEVEAKVQIPGIEE